MKKNNVSIFGYPLFALLLPLALIVNLINNNLNKYPEVSQCLLLFVFTGGSVYIVFHLLNLALKNIKLAGLIAGCFSVLFISYTNVYNFTEKIFGGYSENIFSIIYLLFFLILVAIFFIVRKYTDFLMITRLLNVFSLIFFISGVGLMIPKIITNYNQTLVISKASYSSQEITSNDKPNIYYFIFDTMLNLSIAEDYFDVDTGTFEADMEKEGFYFVDNTGYEGLHLTISSMASLFNPDAYDKELKSFLDEYSLIGYKSDIDYIATQTEFYSKKASQFYELYQNPQFFDIMKKAGYKIVGIGAASMQPTSPLYDIYYSHDVTKNFDNNMFMVFCAATPIDRISNLLFKRNAIIPPVFGDTNDKNLKRIYGPYIDQRDYFKNDVMDITSIPGSKLSICHILMPHYPFVYDADGTVSINAQSFSITRYKEQYEYTLKYIKELMTELLQKDPNAIIVIQGDHGITENHLDMSSLTLSEEEHRDIGTQVFLAVHIPEGAEKYGISKDFCALNIPRVLMNKFASTDFQMIPANFAK